MPSLKHDYSVKRFTGVGRAARSHALQDTLPGGTSWRSGECYFDTYGHVETRLDEKRLVITRCYVLPLHARVVTRRPRPHWRAEEGVERHRAARRQRELQVEHVDLIGERLGYTVVDPEALLLTFDDLRLVGEILHELHDKYALNDENRALCPAAGYLALCALAQEMPSRTRFAMALGYAKGRHDVGSRRLAKVVFDAAHRVTECADPSSRLYQLAQRILRFEKKDE